MDDSDTEFKDAFILTRGRAVVAVGCMADLPDVDESVPRVDLSGRVVIPGLINTHHHMFQSLTRCIAQDETLFGWLKTLYVLRCAALTALTPTPHHLLVGHAATQLGST